MRESLVDGIYELCVEIVTSARRPNVIKCHDSIVVTWMVAACTAEPILSERWTSLEDGCVGHRLTRASTMATGLWETASAPLCRLPGQCWMLKEYLRHFSSSLKRHGLCTLLRSLSTNIPVSF